MANRLKNSLSIIANNIVKTEREKFTDVYNKLKDRNKIILDMGFDISGFDYEAQEKFLEAFGNMLDSYIDFRSMENEVNESDCEEFNKRKMRPNRNISKIMNDKDQYFDVLICYMNQFISKDTHNLYTRNSNLVLDDEKNSEGVIYDVLTRLRICLSECNSSYEDKYRNATRYLDGIVGRSFGYLNKNMKESQAYNYNNVYAAIRYLDKIFRMFLDMIIEIMILDSKTTADKERCLLKLLEGLIAAKSSMHDYSLTLDYNNDIFEEFAKLLYYKKYYIDKKMRNEVLDILMIDESTRVISDKYRKSADTLLSEYKSSNERKSILLEGKENHHEGYGAISNKIAKVLSNLMIAESIELTFNELHDSRAIYYEFFSDKTKYHDKLANTIIKQLDMTRDFESEIVIDKNEILTNEQIDEIVKQRRIGCLEVGLFDNLGERQFIIEKIRRGLFRESDYLKYYNLRNRILQEYNELSLLMFRKNEVNYQELLINMKVKIFDEVVVDAIYD